MGSGLGDVAAAFPRLLGGADFKAIVAAMLAARAAGRPIVWGLGAHVIKTGLAPILIDLMDRGFVSALALNGAGVIHDFEIALGGSTSEDVDAALGPAASAWPRRRDAAERRDQRRRRRRPRPRSGGGATICPHGAAARRVSLASAARLGVPVTVHVAIGTDIIHMHPPRPARRSARAASAISATSSRTSPTWPAAAST